MRSLLRVGLALVVGAVALLGTTRQAAAYPQFQFSSGTQRCAQCHYAPAGFGLLTSWGRDESADTISMAGGDGGFLHGAVELPSSIALGGDIRLAALSNDVGGPGSPETAVFPMQAELYARVAFGDTGVSFYGAFGARGATRTDPEASTLAKHLPAAISRELYLMWKPSASGPYARVGRFYAPFGLRLAEHIYYIRRFTGFNLYQETLNASGGYLQEDWEVHATAFVTPPDSLPTPLQSVAEKGAGAVLFGEKRFASMAAAGAQFRLSSSVDQRVITAGAMGKVWIESAKLLAQGELDVQQRTFPGGGGVNQMIGFFGLTYFPIKGLMAMVAAERYQEDLKLATTARNAIDIQINLFPIAHFEVMLLGRRQLNANLGGAGDPATLGMLQLHYYL